MSSVSHDFAAQFFSETFTEAKNRQHKTSGRLPWRWGSTLKTGLEDGIVNGISKSASKFVADLTAQDMANAARFVLEIAYRTGRKDAIAKISDRLANNPDLVAAVVVTILESPPYERPDRSGSSDDALVLPSWVQAAESSPQSGPIVYRGFRWMGKVTCSLDVHFKGEDQPRVQQLVSLIIFIPTVLISDTQSIIPQSDPDDDKASATFSDIWSSLVRDVGGEGVDPVSFVVDWDGFRLGLNESLSGTALDRYLAWNGGARVRGKELETRLRGKQRGMGDII